MRVRLLVVGIVAVVAVIGLLLAPIADRVPQTQIVAFGIGSYGGRATPTGNMPVNPFGKRDAQAFDSLAEQFPDQFLPVRQEDNALSGAQLLSFLEQEAQSPAVAGRNLIVFCTLHALVQPSGGIELFAIDATPDSPSSTGGAMVPLDDLVERLQRSVARHVLLALDVSRLQSNWRSGILTNDVVAQAQSAANSSTSSTQTPVAILLAASPGQASWPADMQSAFVTALVAGLSGEADGAVDGGSPTAKGAQDRRVTLHELAAFARTRVAAQVSTQFGAPQTVQLIKDTTDYPLAVVNPPRPARPAPSKDQASPAKPPEATVATTKPAADGDTEPGKAPPPTPPKPRPFDWQARLAEMRAARDALQESGRISVLRSRMPFAWRALDAQLELAESLIQGGQADLAPDVVQRADLLEKSLLAGSATSAADLDAARRALGFSPSNAPPSREALAAAAKYLQSLVTAPPPMPGVAPPPVLPADQVPDAWTIQTWLRQQLLADPGSRAWPELRKIVSKLDEIGGLPPTVEAMLVRNAVQMDNAEARLAAGNSLSRLFTLRDRARRLAVERTTALPLIQDDIASVLHALTAAERWMLIVGSERPETTQWLDQAESTLTRCESMGRQYVQTLADWNDLLIELPDYAAWVASRAGDDPRRDLSVESLRTVASIWADSERNRQWDVSSVVSPWPDRPSRWTDLERKLLTLFVDVQRLKQALFPSGNRPATTSDGSFGYLLSEIALHRRDFQEELSRAIPRLGTADKPTPQVKQDARRLLGYAWLSSSDRKPLEALTKLTPQGDGLASRDVDRDGVWQGFWAIAAMSLLSQDPEDTSQLWKDWDRLAELSGKAAGTKGDAEQLASIRRRAELGRSVRLTWRKLQDRAGAVRTDQPASKWALIAATLDPTVIPETDPDQRLLAEESRQLNAWLTLFASDWNQRRWNTRFAGTGAQTPPTAMWELAGATLPGTPPVAPTLNEIPPPKFNPAREGTLEISAAARGNLPTRLYLTGNRIRLRDAPGQNLAAQAVARPAAADGKWVVDLLLDAEVDVAQDLLVVLADDEGFPVDFRQVPLSPPFDPNAWRVELVEPKTGVPLQASPTTNPKGLKVFLPPNGEIAFKAELIRPVKENTPSARLTIFQVGESGRAPIAENIELKLEAGQERTTIVTDLPPPPPPAAAGEAKNAEALPGPLANLALGWVFEITPEGQQPIEFVIRPTFWSATKFVNTPQPELRDDRFVAVIERAPAAKDDLLIPDKIPVEMRLPASLQNIVTDFTLGGPLGAGQTMTLSFKLPPEWRDRARQNTWDIVLDVAGIPHAYRWRLDASGTLPLIGGQPPQVNPRLLLATEPKAPPRLAPIVRRGQEPLHLLFEVDAATLDRTEGNGDWTLSYKVVRETDDGVEATPLQHSWRLFSSLNRHVYLNGVQRGVWKVTTAANDYETIEPASEIRGLAGRFRLNAQLTQADDPQTPVASAALRFAVDDDQPPDLAVKGLTTDARLITLDLPFRIESTDLESGIEKLAYGFDANADKILQPEEIYENRALIGFDNPTVAWPVVVPKSRLPKLEKDEETRRLLVQATNSAGIVTARDFNVTFKKPVVVVPVKATKGKLVVNLQISRGGKATVQITGPDARLEQVSGESITFSDLSPGQYQISVNVNYAVIGRKEKGEAKVDVKAGQTTTAAVPLSQAK
ncbi:hypothetical protein [Caulifigura coniformis]|nr:hypothetical protein [Caulifigura coniformis]